MSHPRILDAVNEATVIFSRPHIHNPKYFTRRKVLNMMYSVTFLDGESTDFLEGRGERRRTFPTKISPHLFRGRDPSIM